jgi:hypothetical protein
MKNITYKNDSYTIPFEITCTVSGQVKVYTSEDFINGKIDRFGGLQKLRDTYVCRDAQRLMQQGKKKEEIIEILTKGLPIARSTVVKNPASPKVPETTLTVAAPEVKLDPVRPLKDVTKPLTKETASAETCYNPAFKLNGKACTDCAFKAICLHADSPKGKLAAMKKAPKKIKVAA